MTASDGRRRRGRMVLVGCAVTALASPVLSSPAAAAEIVGDSGSNVLRGTPERDRIFGRDGNDAIYGRGGRDVIRPGGGRDLSYGGRGRDRFFGSLGDDVYLGRRGNDAVGFPGNRPVQGDKNRGRDLALGGLGDDFLEGALGADVLRGGRGGDTLNPGRGRDTVFAGGGSDTVFLTGDGMRDVIHCGPGFDSVGYIGVTPSEEPKDRTFGCEIVEAV